MDTDYYLIGVLKVRIVNANLPKMSVKNVMLYDQSSK